MFCIGNILNSLSRNILILIKNSAQLLIRVFRFGSSNLGGTGGIFVFWDLCKFRIREWRHPTSFKNRIWNSNSEGPRVLYTYVGILRIFRGKGNKRNYKIYFRISNLFLTDTGENVQKWTRVFFDSALSHTRRSYTSEKKE